MGTTLRPALLACFLILLHTAASSTCKPSTCSSTPGNGIFKYSAGHTYVYHLDGNTLTEVSEAVGEGVKLGLKATAEVHFAADCSATLQLRDVTVTGPSAKKYGNLADLETHAVRFTWHDGQVDTEICADAEDSNTALNVKRAVISLLQVATPQHSGNAAKHETDVFGTCPTEFSITTAGSATHVTKTRNLNTCQHREDLRLRITTTPYPSDSLLQGSPALDADQTVTLSVKGGVLQTAESEETYLYKPFSNKEHGGKTTIHTKLTYVSDSAHAAHSVAGVAKSIIFDSPHGSSASKSSSAGVVAALHDAEKAMPDGVHQAAATEFRHLVEVFRQTNKNDLLTVYGQVKAGAGFKDKVSSRKLYLHALLRTGTGDSVQVAVELLKNNEISAEFHKFWHTSFGFVRHATPAALTAAASLVDAQAPKEVYLGVGALLGKYCAEHSCAGLKEFDDLLGKLAKPLAAGCNVKSHSEEDKLIHALKGLQNAKHLNEKVAELLRVCAADHGAPARVRVVALETYKTDACQPQLKKSALEILVNHNEDSELRIRAYLAATRCADGKVANAIKTLLDSEPVNQVGSFIVSHLRQLRASKNPFNADQRHHFSEIRSAKKFPVDMRRFSHFHELSYFLDAVNIGSSIESPMIYSQQSYLLRAVDVKLNTNVFGHSFNLLELGTRAQNLDRVIESYFGPRGYFEVNDVEDILHNGTQAIIRLRKKLDERVKESLRHRRDIPSRFKRSVPETKLEEFRNTIALENDHKTIDLDLNVKMFDTNIGGLSYHGNPRDLNPDSIIDKIFGRVDNCLDKLKNFNHEVKHHAMLYETELAYPTGLGFPLKLTATVTSAVHLKVDGKIDIRAIIKDPSNAHVQFEVVPSAAIEVQGLLSIDAHAVEAGLRLGAVLHTSSGVNVNVRGLGGAGVDVVVGLPVKKQELVNLKTEVTTSVREEGHAPVETAVAFNTKRKDYHGCFDQLSHLVGLTFCGDVGVPVEGVNSKAAFFPLNGPAKLVLTVESDDVTTYKFRAVHNTKDDDRRSLELLVDTPGSNVNRKVELLIENFRKPNREFRVKLTSPYKTALAEVVVVQSEKEKSLTGKVLNGEEEYLVKVGAAVSGTHEHQTYTPIFEVSTPTSKTGKKGKKGKGGYNVAGSVVVDRSGESRKFTFNHVTLSVPAGQVGVDGWVATEPHALSTDLKFTSADKDTVTIKTALKHPAPAHFSVDAEVVASAFPDLGVHLKWNYLREKHQLTTDLDVVHGNDLASTQARITAEVSAKYVWVSRHEFDISGKAKATYPLLGIEGHAEGGGSPNHIHYTLQGTYQKHQVSSHLSAKKHVKEAGDYQVEFEAKVLDSGVKLASARDVTAPGQSRFTNSLELTPGGHYELNADVTCHSQPGDVNRRVVAEAKIAGQPDPYKLDVGVVANPKVFEAHGKASVGATDWVDAAVKLSKAPNPSGSFKALLKDHVDGAGQFKYQDGAGTLAATVHLIKLDRKLKAAGDLTVSGTNHVLNLDLFSDFDKDPSKKIHVSSTTDCKPGSVDSKNILIVLEHKTEFNVKGTQTGKFLDGHLVGEADLTLPNGRHVSYKVDRQLHVRTGNSEYDVKVEAATKDKSGHGISVKVLSKGEKIDLKQRVFDSSLDVLYTNAAGKDVNYQFLAKSLPEGEKHHVELKGLVKGSLLELTPLVHLKVDVHKPAVDYFVKVDLASDFNLELTGNTVRSVDGSVPYHRENNLELNLPTGELKNIKVIDNWTFTRGKDGAPCHLVGSASATFNNNKPIKIAADVTGSRTEGSGKVTLNTPKDEHARVVQYSFKVDKTTGVKRDGSITLTHGDKECHVDVATVVPEEKNAIQVTVNARSSLEQLKTVHIVFHGARSDKLVTSETALLVNDKKTDVITKYGLDPRNPVGELSVIHPNGKTIFKYHFTHKDVARHTYDMAVYAEHKGETFDLASSGRAPSAHDFDIAVDLDVHDKVVTLNKVHIELANKQGAAGKTISVVATEAGQNVVNGNLNYHYEDGSDGVLYEASGKLKVKNEDKDVKISLKRHNIVTEEEKGNEIVFHAHAGDALYEFNYKKTDKEMQSKARLCKKKDTCGFSEYHIQHRVAVNDIWHHLVYEVDLRGLGVEHHSRIEGLTERKDSHVLQTLELVSNAEKYSYKFQVSDKEALLQLTTPHRTVEADAKFHLDVNQGKDGFKYKLEGSAWLDKIREPTLKSSLLVEADLIKTEGQTTLSEEIRFQHPALGKDLVLKNKLQLGGRSIVDSNIEIDIFAKRGQKITIETKLVKNTIDSGFNVTLSSDIKSKGQSLDVVFEGHVAGGSSVVGAGAALAYKDDKGKKDLGFGYQATHTRVAFYVKSPRDVLVNVEANLHGNEGQPKVEALVEIVGLKALVLEAHAEKPHKLSYVIYKKETPERKITGYYQLELATKLSANSEWHQGSENKELFNVDLQWKTDSKPHISYSLENTKALLVQTRGDVSLAVDKLKAASQALADGATVEFNDVIEGMKKSKPNFINLIASYEAQIKQIRAEVEQDKAVQKMSDLVKKVIGAASEAIARATELFVKLADRALDLFEKISTAALSSLKRIVPAVSQSVNKIFQTGVELSSALINSLLIGLQSLVELIKKHEAEFQEVVAVVAEISRDIARYVGKTLDQVWREVRDFTALLVEQLKALPMYSMIQERLHELKQQLKEFTPPEQVFETLHEVTTALQDTLPTQELKDFVQALSQYIEKVLKKQDVDDIPELRKIYAKFLTALKSLLVLIQSEVDGHHAPGVLKTAWPLSLKNALRVPLQAAIHLSPLDFLKSDDKPTLRELWFAYRPTLDPTDWVPPFKSYGVLLDSSHFFTMDGRHFTFAGTCSYVLAQDVVNGNFTLVLNLEAGKFKSLQLSDDKDTLEIIKGGKVLLNGAAHELPIKSHHLSAWARYHSVNIKTDAGVKVKVDVDHHYAVFQVNGFYHGQVRGLLGDLNNEQFDDFRLPSGKVTEDVAEFGNAYHVGAACAPGTASAHHGHHGHHEAECSSLFAASSSLRNAFPVIDPSPFREACDHYLSETTNKKEEYACRIATVYVDLARKHSVFVDVPSKCAACSASGKSWPLGETHSVPHGNMADIVFIVEAAANNSDVYKDLVGPLVTSLSAELKTKGVSDVHFALISYGHPAQKYPAHHTINGKIAFDGKAQLEFADDESLNDKIDIFIHRVEVELGDTPLADAIVEASKYPFRAGASKASLVVTSSGCEKSVVTFGLQTLRTLYAQKVMRDRGIAFHVVTSLHDFNVAGSSDAKQLKSIVGFDKHGVYSLSDAKKKPLDGNADLRKDIEYHADVCVEVSQKTDGATFHAGNFLEGKAGQRKNFLTVVTRRVADSLVGDFSEDCTCQLHHGKHAHTSCKLTTQKAKKH